MCEAVVAKFEKVEMDLSDVKRRVGQEVGGGELIDQGVHLIDLARVFLGEFTTVEGLANTMFWKMPVDDNAFMTLRTGAGQVAFLHVSCSEWKNLFSLEIYGRDAKLAIDGLGGSYGVERLAFYRMLPQMGPPETTTWEFLPPDVSWDVELREFVDAAGAVEPERTGELLFDGSPRPGLIEAHFTAEERFRPDAPQHQIGVRDGRLRAAAAIADRAWVGAGAVRADLERADIIAPGYRSAACTNLDDIDHRQHHRVTGCITADVIARRQRRLTVTDQACHDSRGGFHA